MESQDSIKEQFCSEITELALDPKHPGINDGEYVKRRELFFNTSREFRLKEKGVPRIEYNENEDGVWRHVMAKLSPAHQRYACEMYLEGFDKLAFDKQTLPQLADLSEQLKQFSGFEIVPAEGLINFRDFFGYLSRGQMPCTQYLRHHGNPEYTPEPDMLHDLIGHIPFLSHSQYADFIRLVGNASQKANEEQLLYFNRLYWFGVEFGLIEEKGEVKVFGAGLLSSFGEMEYCLSGQVERLPFVIEDVIERDYDPTQMQPVLYVLSSFADMVNQTERLITRLGL